MTNFIGVDLGGTHLRAALCDSSGVVTHRMQQSIETSRAADVVVSNIVTLLAELEERSAAEVAAIGIGVPGIVSMSEGTVYQSPHFPDWCEYPLRSVLEEKLTKPLFISNDANCHALAESQFGVASDVANMMMLTLGTGIGGGIVIADELFTGDKGFAAEFGHIVVESSGVPCNCGGKGCLEMYASATGLRKETGFDPDVLYERASRGDKVAQAIFEKMGAYLGIGIASLVNALGIHTIVIGGGVSAAWDFFAENMNKEFGSRTYHETARITQIRKSQLGDNSGILGAAYGASRVLRKAS